MSSPTLADLNPPSEPNVVFYYAEKTLLTGWELVGTAWNRIERSKSFPMIRVADLNPFLQPLATDGDTKVQQDFRAWIRALPRY